MPKYSVTDQIKSLRDDIKDFYRITRTDSTTLDIIERKLKSVSIDVSDLRNDLKTTNKRFDHLEKQLFNWKSELFTKIDTGYSKPLKDNIDEHASIQFRLSEHQSDIDKLKSQISVS